MKTIKYGFVLEVPEHADDETAQAMREDAIAEWRSSARRAGYEVFDEPYLTKMYTDRLSSERMWQVEGNVESRSLEG